MFGADLAYIDSCIEDEYVSESLLPEYLYPAFRVTNPWHRQSDKTQLETDIIVIAEFSELEGPKPVITIPHDRDTHFDVNEFTVRIMSVDQGSSGQQGFNMQEDYQVLMSDTKENVYAFNHHFVLLDKQARGYSRPFAISYVTPDQRKLLNFHEEISSSFKRIARYIKYGNKLVFKNDLDKFMIDLQYTKDQIVNRFRSTVLSNPSDSDNKLLQSLKTLESQISEVQGILSQLNPTLNDKRLEQRFSKIEERAQVSTEKQKYDSASLQEWESIDTPENVDCRFSSLGNSSEPGSLIFFDSQHYKPKLVEISKGRKFDLHLRGLHELCSSGAKEGVQKLRFIYKYFQQDISVLQKEKRDVALLDPPSGLVTFGSKYIAANFMTDIDKICISSCCFMRVPGTRSNIETMNLLVRSWSSNDTLSSFKSVPSSFQSIQKEDDTESMLSATSDLYIQRPNSLGSFHLVGSYDSFNLSESPLTCGLVLDIDHSSIQFGNDSMVDHSEHTNNVSENLKNVTENNGCENTSENSSERSEKCSNASNQDAQFGTNVQDVASADIDKNMAGHGKNKSTCIAVDSDIESSCERERSSTIVNDEDANFGDNSAINPEKNNEVIGSMDGKDDKIKKEEVDGKTEANSPKNKMNAYVKDDEKEIRTDAFSEKEKNLLNCSRDLENLGSTIVDGHLKCQTGIRVSSCDECQLKKSQTFKTDENRDCNHGDGISRAETETDLDKTDIFKFDSCTDILSLGFGILQVVLSYNYIQNVIFSLLTGRTVVVIGAPAYEEEVRQVITGLKLFLPGCHRCASSCVLWSGKAITFKDLSEVKLIGICRPEKKSVDRMIPKSVQPYITLLDVERRMIKSPVYQGSLITTILSRKKSFKTEDSFINFIKMLLCDFSSKAFIFFHSFCLGSVGTLIHENEEVTKKSDFAKKTTTNFLSKLGVQDNDVHIIEYLTELMKYQHIEDHYMSLNLTGAPPRPVHKDVHPCQIFKC